MEKRKANYDYVSHTSDDDKISKNLTALHTNQPTPQIEQGTGEKSGKPGANGVAETHQCLTFGMIKKIKPELYGRSVCVIQHR